MIGMGQEPTDMTARDGVRRFLEEIPLSDDELAAAEGDAAKLNELIEKNKHRSPPRARAGRRSGGLAR